MHMLFSLFCFNFSISFCFWFILSDLEQRGWTKVKTWNKARHWVSISDSVCPHLHWLSLCNHTRPDGIQTVPAWSTNESAFVKSLKRSVLENWESPFHWQDKCTHTRQPPAFLLPFYDLFWADVWTTCYQCVSEPELQMSDMQQEMAVRI